MPLAWYDVLINLNDAPERRLRLQELVRRTLLTKSGISRLIDRMEAAGLVRREMCPMDRRGAYAVLTSAGRRALRRAAPSHLADIQNHFARHLSDDDVAILDAVLERLLTAINPPPPASAGVSALLPGHSEDRMHPPDPTGDSGRKHADSAPDRPPPRVRLHEPGDERTRGCS